MARYFAPGEHLTYDDFLSLRAELFNDVEIFLEEKFNLSERLEILTEGIGDIITDVDRRFALLEEDAA